MKRSLYIAILALLFPVAVQAQIIRYDTIRSAPRQSQTAVAPQQRQVTTASAQQQQQQQSVRPRTGGEGRHMFGGNIGISANDNEWALRISPQYGYRVANRVMLGAGISYIYAEGRGRYDYSASSAGINAFGRVYPIESLMLFAQPEITRQWGHSEGVERDTGAIFCLPVGAGALVPAGPGSILMSLYYDVIQSHRSPYGNRLNFSVGYQFVW
ncbi:MAG: hypothetical protein FWE10_00655 [Rikenellaceae bacterium]|nr:hypothetical protein [Rikenellaceae bacterium]